MVPGNILRIYRETPSGFDVWGVCGHQQKADKFVGFLVSRQVRICLGHVPECDLFMAMSEVAVHPEMLIERGGGEVVESGPPTLYRVLQFVFIQPNPLILDLLIGTTL
jgi:hypothetical protein